MDQVLVGSGELADKSLAITTSVEDAVLVSVKHVLPKCTHALASLARCCLDVHVARVQLCPTNDLVRSRVPLEA